MRFLAVLLVAGLFASAGCFGKDDDNGDDTTPTPTPTGGTGTATPTGATPTATPTTPATPTAPVVLPPKEVCTISYNFQQPPGAPGTAPAPISCTVPAGYKKLTMSGNFTGNNPAPAPSLASGVKMTLNDPAATAAGSCSVTDGPVPGPVACTAESGTATPGEWKVQPAGTGTVTFTGVLIAS